MQLHSFVLCAVASLIAVACGQQVHVPECCTGKFKAGSDTAIVTLPYNYRQVIGIIGSFKNLTWSGNPDSSVTLNGTNNKPGTARTYVLKGPSYSLPVTETLIAYEKPPFGPYLEVHNSNLTKIPAPLGIDSYIPCDITTVHQRCLGKATTLNFTAHFCSNKPTAAATLLHTLHTADGENVGKLLGGKIFTGCETLWGLPNNY